MIDRQLSSRPLVAALALALSLALGTSCGEPVRDAQIKTLGGEDPAVAPGPDHRPGQPCVLCHSDGGPASGSSFAVAGTVYATDQPGSGPAEVVELVFVDTLGGAPRGPVLTSAASGNFFVRASDWPNLEFPFRVGVEVPDPKGGAAALLPMGPVVNREGSCNFCHQPAPAPPLSGGDGDALRSSIGQIYLQRGGS